MRLTQKTIVLFIFLGFFLSGFSPRQDVIEKGDQANVQVTQVDTSQFPLVTVYVSLTDEQGQPLGVAPQEIRIKEEGKVITPDQFIGMGEVSDLTTLLVIDVSGSMNSGDKLQAAKSAALAYIEQMRPGDRAGLLTFNTKIDLVHPVTRDTVALSTKITQLEARNDTVMYDALFEAVDYLDSFMGRKAIIALTDGLDNRSTHDMQDVIDQIGPSGLSISTIGLGDPSHGRGAQTALDEGALENLAKSAGGVYGYAEDELSLMKLYELYGRKLQSEYEIAYTSPSSVRDGINRSLQVYLESIPSQAGMSEYNPGGLVPETGQPVSWSLFLYLFTGLLLLLALPRAIKFGLQFVRKEHESPVKIKLSRIKLKE